MPRPRNATPPVLVGRRQQLIEHFWRDYDAIVEMERSLPREQRFVSHVGPSYAAIGWLAFRERYRRKRAPKGVIEP